MLWPHVLENSAPNKRELANRNGVELRLVEKQQNFSNPDIIVIFKQMQITYSSQSVWEKKLTNYVITHYCYSLFQLFLILCMRLPNIIWLSKQIKNECYS